MIAQLRRLRLWPAVAILVVLGLYCGLARSSLKPAVRNDALSHYQLLTDALLSGQNSLKVVPEPGLARLANPWAGAQGVTRIHDATYFENKYFLYFGPAPVLTWLGPWWLLTRTFSGDGLSVLVFTSFGFVFLTLLWLGIVKHHLREASPLLTAAVILMLGLGSFASFILTVPEVYGIAISSGFACLSFALLFLFRGYSSAGAPAAAISFGVSSTAWGMAVAARPHMGAGLAVLGWVALLAYLSQRQLGIFDWRRLRILFWAVFPAAAIGLGLVFYNLMRFADPLEFGVKYQLAASDQHFVKVIGLEYISKNLAGYLLSPCYYSRYFPYVVQPGPNFGALTWAPFCATSLLFPFVAVFRPRNGKLMVVLFALTAVALINYFMLWIVVYANDRYQVDVLPFLTLVGCISGAAFWIRAKRRAVRSLVALLFGGLAAFTFSHSALMLFWRDRQIPGWEPLARTLTWVTYAYEQCRPTQFGPLESSIVFKAQPKGVVDPLVSDRHGRDTLFVEYLENNYVRFGFFHLGTISPYSEPILIEPGKSYALRLDLGLFYPPPFHPAFRHYSREAITAFRHRIEVFLDQKKVYGVASDFYEGTPADVVIGSTPNPFGTAKRFSGTLSNVVRTGIPMFGKGGSGFGQGPVRFHLKFPTFTAMIKEPLVSTGAEGSGDVIYVSYLGPGKICFGDDSTAFGGAIESRVVEFDPEVEHTIDVLLGQMEKTFPAKAGGPIMVRFDGKQVLSTYRIFPPATTESVTFGFNAAHSSVTASNFTGKRMDVQPLEDGSLASPKLDRWGAVSLTLLLPTERVGTHDPLVVSGVPGRADLVFVSYEDVNHIRIGYDHLGSSVVMSDPIEIDPAHSVSIQISHPGLYPPDGDKWWTKWSATQKKSALERVEFRVNKKVVFSKELPFHPAQPDTITCGLNTLGGSSCGESFMGLIESIVRTPFLETPDR